MDASKIVTATAEALRRSSHLRRWLVFFVGAAPITLAIIAMWAAQSEDLHDEAMMATWVIAIVALILGLLLSLTDRDTSGFVEELGVLQAQVNDRANDVALTQNELAGAKEALRDQMLQVDYWRTLYVYKQAISNLVGWYSYWRSYFVQEQNLSDTAHQFLDMVVHRRQQFFGFEAGERWTIAIYVAYETVVGRELRCVAFRGDATRDNGGIHRSWPEGIGHIGLSAMHDWTVLVDDSRADHWFELFKDRRPEATHETLERDRELYRSFAVIPFKTNAEPGGAICATSDLVGRFNRVNIAPLYDLAYAVADVLRSLQSQETVQAQADATLDEARTEGHTHDNPQEHQNDAQPDESVEDQG